MFRESGPDNSKRRVWRPPPPAPSTHPEAGSGCGPCAQAAKERKGAKRGPYKKKTAPKIKQMKQKAADKKAAPKERSKLGRIAKKR